MPVLERAGRLDRVAQDLRDRRHHVGVGVAHRGGQAEVVHDLRDLRVDPLEVVVDGDQVAAQRVAAALERRRDRVQGQVDVGRLHRAQQRVEVGQHLLHLDRHLGPGDRGAGLQRLGRRVLRHDERDVLLAEQRLGHDRAGHVGGDRVHLAGEDPELHLRALVGRAEAEHLADDDAADLHVGALGHLQADGRRVEGDLVEVRELLGEHAVGEPHPAQEQAEEGHAEGLELECGSHRQPASLTVVAAPQIAIERNRSITLIATMLVRTALPTATPTPAGPPEAL